MMVPNGGFWWRVLAYIIDAIILSIVGSILGRIVGFSMMPMSGMGANANLFASGAMFGVFGLSVVLNWIYFAGMESSKFQGTVGKLAIGLVVTDMHGDRISFMRATGRYFAKILSGIILSIGFIMVAFTQRKQGLHDLIASTLVYKTRDPGAVISEESVFA
ncbi:RDD family protein [Novosphingobium sp. Rr 2-17]|uniref:RDD family protein n=1 Tax=Novosphingobium sp. Rr 2-17 TaxID=555793 RepID=UPI001ED8DA73|nr:RDD family protein [Novosphingobium sp. Rr 2-17]